MVPVITFEVVRKEREKASEAELWEAQSGEDQCCGETI